MKLKFWNLALLTMWFLWIISWLAWAIQIGVAFIALAAGLFYASELVEEYSIMAERVIRLMIIFCIMCYVCLLVFEGFPLLLCLSGAFAHVIHLILVRRFPAFQPQSIEFVLAIVLFIVNHYLSFSYFKSEYHEFSEVIGYFTICVWACPFTLLISLSANDLTLPSTERQGPAYTQMLSLDNYNSDKGDTMSHYITSRASKKYGLRQFFKYLNDTLMPKQSKRYN